MSTKTVKSGSCTFLSCVWEETVCSLSACFRIMELCHILFKVRLIRGDSEPLICCHNADVFILSVTMALLCVGLPRAALHTGLISKPGGLTQTEKHGAKQRPVSGWAGSNLLYSSHCKRCSAAGDTDSAGAL